MPATKSDIARLIELARAQIGEPGDWSIATDAGWLERTYVRPGVLARLWELPTGELTGSAAVSATEVHDQSATITAASMLRPGHEELWGDQRGWIDAALREASAGITTPRIQVVSESLSDPEVLRWASAGYRLAFEELAMDRDLPSEWELPSPRWPSGSRLVDWGTDAAAASFDVYTAAFRDRPGFPGWSQSEWIDRLTGGVDFLPRASMCVLLEGVPAGFVVCSTGWIDQIGVAPRYRRMGLAGALIAEAVIRMRRIGLALVRLHVNVNNPGALAAWEGLGWHAVGRRGRFEGAPAPR